jgi:hypothetical protein
MTRAELLAAIEALQATSSAVSATQAGFHISARARTEQAYRRVSERLAALHAIDRAIQQVSAPATIAEIVLAHLGRLIPFQRGAVLLYESESAGALLASVGGLVARRLCATTCRLCSRT